MHHRAPTPTATRAATFAARAKPLALPLAVPVSLAQVTQVVTQPPESLLADTPRPHAMHAAVVHQPQPMEAFIASLNPPLVAATPCNPVVGRLMCTYPQGARSRADVVPRPLHRGSGYSAVQLYSVIAAPLTHVHAYPKQPDCTGSVPGTVSRVPRVCCYTANAARAKGVCSVAPVLPSFKT